MSAPRRPFTKCEDKIIRQMWDAGATLGEIGERLNRNGRTISAYTRHRGWTRTTEQVAPPKKTHKELRDARRRINADLLRRKRIAQPDPIVIKPPPGLLSFPIREFDPETRALIDVALRERETSTEGVAQS